MLYLVPYFSEGSVPALDMCKWRSCGVKGRTLELPRTHGGWTLQRGGLGCYFLQSVQRPSKGTTSLSNSALLFQLPHFYDSGPCESAQGLTLGRFLPEMWCTVITICAFLWRQEKMYLSPLMWNEITVCFIGILAGLKQIFNFISGHMSPYKKQQRQIGRFLIILKDAESCHLSYL